MNIVLATLAMALSAAIADHGTTDNDAGQRRRRRRQRRALRRSTTAPIPAGYVPLVDDTDSIVIAVPEAWTDVDTAPKGTRGSSVRTSPLPPTSSRS